MAGSPAALLQAYSKEALGRVARQRGLDIRGQNKEALVRLLASALSEADAIRRNLATLGPIERRVLDEVLLLGGDAPTGLIQRRLAQEGAVRPALPRAHLSSGREPARAPELPSLSDVVAGLTSRGLVFSSGASAYGQTLDLTSPGQRLLVPTWVLDQLSSPSLPLSACTPPEYETPCRPDALLHDMYVLLSAADSAPIPLTTRGLIVKRALVQLDEQMHVHEPVAAASSENNLRRLPLLRLLAEDLGLLVASPSGLCIGEQVAEFLSQPGSQRQAQLLRAYRETARWCELFRVDGLEIQAGGAWRGAPREVIAARQRVLAELAALPSGCWIAQDDVLARLKRCAYELLFRRRVPADGAHWYYQSPYAGDNPLGWTFARGLAEEQGWDLVEGGLIKVVVESLHQLGVLDLGGDAAHRNAIRITAAGSQLLREEPVTPTNEPPNVVVQPNFQIFVFAPLDESVLYRLDQFADKVRSEQVVEYRLSRESVYRAQRRGLDVNAIAAFLDRVSAVPLAQNVRRSLDEWGALHERVVLRRGTPLLHTVDGPTLDGLYADAQIAPLLGRRLSATAALVARADLAALHERLQISDRLPALSEGRTRSVQPALAVDASGCITFTQRLPDVDVLRVVGQVADTQPDGSARLTPTSLLRAAVNGLGPDQILAMLAAVHDGPLPAELAPLVRRGGHRWGHGTLTSVTILQVESADLLAELLADPEVGPHLSRLTGADSVALVARESVKHVRAALQARGMDLAG